MNPSPPPVEVKIAPAHILSSRNPSDYGWVLAWTLWSPVTFVRYVDWLLKSNKGETPFPKQVKWQEIQEWWDKNPHQRALVGFAVEVGILVVLGLAAIILLHVVALSAVNSWQLLERVLFYCGLLLLAWVVSVGLSLRVAANDGNVGNVLIAALPRGLEIALAWLVLCWWFYINHLLAADSSLQAAIFLLWGYALGFAFNFQLALRQTEDVSPGTIILWYLIFCALIFGGLLWASGVALQPVFAMDKYAPVLWAAFWCCFGLLAGLLRPLEYLLLLRRTPPGPDQEGRARVWLTPGATLLPAYRMRRAVDKWLDADRDEGVYVASQLSHASRQQLPLIVPLQGQLALCETDEMLELGFSIYESGAKYATKVVSPPLASGPKPKTRRVKGQDRRTYEHETGLANIPKLSSTPPEFKLDNDANMASAMFWYYSQGHPYKAAKVWQQAGGKNGALARSSPRVAELGALIDAFESLIDLNAASATPNLKLPERPVHQCRGAAWNLIDQLTAATRWVWRARHCEGAKRNDCCSKFEKEIDQIVLQAESTLAEQKMILRITSHWQTQIKKLLHDGKAQPGFESAKIRPWKSMHGELGESDPWGRLRAKLRRKPWKPGYTVVAIVDGLPQTEVGAAVQAAASGPPAITWTTYDLKLLRDEPAVARLPGFKGLLGDAFKTRLLADICNAVAVALNLAHKLPTGWANLKPDALKEQIGKLCTEAPATRVVLYIENAGRLVSDLSTDASKLVLEELWDLERHIHNLALTFECGSGQEMAEQLRSKITAAGLKIEPVYVPLLDEFGVQRWLKAQFDVAGVYFEKAEAEKVYRLTGGHPYLLEFLGQCIADNYNDHFPAAPPCPLISMTDIELAAKSTYYTRPSDKLSKEVLEKYGHIDKQSGDAGKRHRWLLKVLASFTLSNMPATLAEIEVCGTVGIKLPALYVEAVLKGWVDAGLVEKSVDQNNETRYQLRCHSLAQPLEKRAAKIP